MMVNDLTASKANYKLANVPSSNAIATQRSVQHIKYMPLN
jgi:hypothetical protein